MSTHGVTRRPRDERYVSTIPSEEWSTSWMASIVGMLDPVLDYPGNISMQDIADSLDYGPDRLSPRQAKGFKKIADAFYRSMAEADENCKRGDHRWRNGRCVHCKETKLKVVPT